MTALLLSILLGAATAALFGAAIPGAVFGTLGLAIVYSVILSAVVAGVQLKLRERAMKEAARKLTEAINSGKGGTGFGTYL